MPCPRPRPAGGRGSRQGPGRARPGQGARAGGARNLHYLGEAARDCFGARKAKPEGEGTAGRWFGPPELHILPKPGKMPVAGIGQTGIRDSPRPTWHSEPETARQVLNRLALCLRHAAALGRTAASFSHDAAGNVTRVEYANGGPAAFWEETGLDGLGRVLTTLGAMGQAWSYAHDKEDNLVMATDPLTHTEIGSHDPPNRLIATLDRGGFTTQMGWDAQDRLHWPPLW